MGKQSRIMARIQALICAGLLITLGFLVRRNWEAARADEALTPPQLHPVSAASTQPPLPPDIAEVTPEPTPEPLPVFNPRSSDATRPELLIASSGIQVNNAELDSYALEDPVDFGLGEDYSRAIPGLFTFRGNNFRDSAQYGIAEISEGKMTTAWTAQTTSIQAPDGEVWTGHGWTGQPLVAAWPKETRRIMTNMKDWAREQEELTEVIYAGEDGYIYYLELETGKPTRDKQFLGIVCKGSGSLDPRGLPLLYLGGGYGGTRGQSRAFVISLINGELLYEFGLNEYGYSDSFAHRPWPMFDASPLVDADTDQLIYPGENGIIYIIKLNTLFDGEQGTLSIDPEVVKWRYKGTKPDIYWLGFEGSPVIWRSHLICGDNGGRLICIDLNTLELAWVQDVLDDTNCTPVLELEDGHPYIYISTSNRDGLRIYDGQRCTIPIWKIDAETGDIVWQTDYKCYTAHGLSGGVQGSFALGKNDLDGMLFVPVARYPNIGSGQLVALDKNTGEELWNKETPAYSWSTPTCVYTEDGRGYILYPTSGGYLYLLDGLTGETLDYIDLGGTVEASPAVFDNTVVIGTRAQRIYGITLR